MAACAYCGAETELYENGVPICLECCEERERKAKKKPPVSGQSIRSILGDDIAKATARVNQASQIFFEVMGKVPSGFPHPDGSQHIQNVSRELSAAREELMRAHTRLNDFLRTGTVPKHLKQA